MKHTCFSLILFLTFSTTAYNEVYTAGLKCFDRCSVICLEAATAFDLAYRPEHHLISKQA